MYEAIQVVSYKETKSSSLSGHVNLSREVLYQVPVLAAERKERKNLKKQRKVKDFSNSINVL